MFIRATSYLKGLINTEHAVAPPGVLVTDVGAKQRLILSEFGPTSVVVLGAGFSAAATDGRLPLMATFFEGISRKKYSLLASFLDDSAGRAERANVERVLLLLEQIENATDRALAATEQRWRRQCRDIKHQLVDYVLERLRPCLEIEESNWAANLLFKINTGATIISLNYDNIAERILSCRPGLSHHTASPTCPHCKMCRMLKLACSCNGRNLLAQHDWSGSIIKPHGSIAWKRCCNSTCCSYECLVADRHCQPFEACKCGDCGTTCEPVIVLPSMSKRLAEIPEIGVMWEATRAALNSADSLLLFGFSLPLSDSLLTHAICRAIRDNKSLNRISIIDLDPQAIANRLQEITPDDRPLDVRLFRVERGVDPSWISGA